jgi:hypothetical protein
VESPVSAAILERAPMPSNLDAWIGPKAQRLHASWSEGLATRIHHPVFQQIVSCLPPILEHSANLVRFTACEWQAHQLILDTVPALSAASRRRWLVLHRLRFLVIRAAEAAVMLRATSTDLEDAVHDLTAWAWTVCQQYSAISMSRSDGAADPPTPSLMADLQKLLTRRFPDRVARMVAFFDDPLLPPQAFPTC